MHEPIPEQGRWLAQVVRGYFAYHAVPTNAKSLVAFRGDVKVLWMRVLCKRSQKDTHDLGAHGQTGGGVPTQTANPSSLAKRPLPCQVPEVEVECLNRARSVLCGGRPVMGVPIAIKADQPRRGPRQLQRIQSNRSPARYESTSSSREDISTRRCALASRFSGFKLT